MLLRKIPLCLEQQKLLPLSLHIYGESVGEKAKKKSVGRVRKKLEHGI